MAGPYRCQYVFNAGKNGWAETWYLTAASTLANAVNFFNSSVPARQALTATSVVIEATRVTDLSTPRVGRVTPFANAPAGEGFLSRDTSFSAVTLRLSDSTGLFRRTVTLRGVSDDWIVADTGAFPLNPAVVNLFNTFILFGQRGVIPPLLCWQALDRGNLNTPIPITGIIPNVASNFMQITAAAHGLAVNQFCRLALIRGDNCALNPPSKGTLNGIWKVNNVIDVNNFTIPVLLSQLPGVPVLSRSGLMYRRNLVYPTTNVWGFIGVSRRQTGKAFFVPPGHSKALKQR